MPTENLDIQTQWKQAYASLVEFGRAALTTSALLNGGAAAAILTGATANNLNLVDLKSCLLLFCIGAASSLFALSFSYFAESHLLQLILHPEKETKLKNWEIWPRRIAMFFGALSIISFCIAVWLGYIALRCTASPPPAGSC